jgi:hypothetical protein
MKAICPLCSTDADATASPGDLKQYACPICGTFEIRGSDEKVVMANPDVAQSHRELVARERSRGILVPKVGMF